MSLYSQGLLDLHDKLIVDLFAGGGGASSGIEQALGRMVDIAINHDPAAVSLHQANHPQTLHMVSDVFEVDPRYVTDGRPVGFLWASPDCTFHSKARGSKPIRSATKKRRALAWVVTRWAGQVRPDVIMLENVEEFALWGPLVGSHDNLRPCPKRKGKTFRSWVRSLTSLGYVVEWRELKACDYGAPTIRKRLFLIARCDGNPIVWPEPTHGLGRSKPYRTAAECIDWSIPMLSIFATKEEAKAWGKAHGQSSPIRPLAENTNRRIARGVKRYVLDNPKPFLVNVANSKTSGRAPNVWTGDEPLRTITSANGFAAVAPIIAPITHGGDRRTPSADEPIQTITCAHRGELGLIAPYMVPRYGERDGQSPRSRSVTEPMPVVVPDGNGAQLVSSHLTKFRTGSVESELSDPMPTVTANSSDTSHPGGATPLGIVAANVATYYGSKSESDARGMRLDEPLHTQPTENRHALVASFLAQNNEGFYDGDGRSLEDSAPTICATGSTQSLIAAHIQRDFGNSVGGAADDPIGTITADRNGHAGLIASFLSKYYGTGDGQHLAEPIHTIPTVDRFGFVTVSIDGTPHYISDIAMRMLQPRELYLAQGFRPNYIIDRGFDGKPLTKTEQVRMCGNSVCPSVAEALVRANCPHLIARSLPKAKRAA